MFGYLLLSPHTFNILKQIAPRYFSINPHNKNLFVYNFHKQVPTFDYTYINMKKTTRITLALLETVLVVSLLAVALLFFAHNAHAQTGIPAAGVELTGYAWSDTIGWISMNCRTGGATSNDICASSSYRVTLATGGALTGYAWSDNIGWVKFDGLSGFPVQAGTVAASARVTGAYPNVTFEGWARACAGTAPGDCSTMASRTDGWDGWISLGSTAAPAYSIVMTGTASGALLGSYAWGSTVVGWVDFDQVGFRTATATLTGTGCQIAIGASTCNGTFTWTITNATSPNVRNSTTNNTYASVAAGTNAPYPITFGSNTIQARDNTTVLFTRAVTGTCPAGADFTTGTCQPAALPAPVITLTTNKTIARTGDTALLTWTISRALVAGETCTLAGPGMSPSSPVLVSGVQTSGPLRSKTRFTMTCTGAFGTVRASTEVEIIPTASEV
jgi:hypothetical protein